MDRLQQDSLARLILTATYHGGNGRYTDHYFCPTVNLWRDFFHPDHLQRLLGASSGETRTLVAAETIGYDPAWRLKVRQSQWRPPGEPVSWPRPRQGRWYPQGFLAGVSGLYPQMRSPMRIVALDDQWLEVECNHPLADMELTVSAEVVSVASPEKERGGRCSDWLEDSLADGPGMQVVRAKEHPDYEDPGGCSRADELADHLFYQAPRLVDHIDSQAESLLLGYMAGLVGEGDRVLDLMSSINSHLPPGPVITGLGMNETELAANPRLARHVVHDINAAPALPFADASFDLVCCHLSIEYLVAPARVMREVARVLTPGGTVAVSFSNRWFPGKVTRIWQQLHEFERMRYVLAMLPTDFPVHSTTTYRNWPRPIDDAHQLQVSDPLYLVTARKA